MVSVLCRPGAVKHSMLSKTPAAHPGLLTRTQKGLLGDAVEPGHPCPLQ